MPVTSAAKTYAYMSRSHPNAFLRRSGASVLFTNSAHSGAITLKSSTFTTEGAFPVGASLNF
eukprot:31350-Pelagococcus_subviridis.AAC.6